MTLILSCITDDAVFQVSDRRLTSFNCPGEVVHEETNKAVLVSGHVAFGYTGTSHVGNTRTDDWLAGVIATAQGRQSRVIDQDIAREATTAFRALPWEAKYKRHAFQGVGWFVTPDRNAVRAGVITIHNALDEKGQDWVEEARAAFDVTAAFGTPKRNQFFITAVGAAFHAEDRYAVHDFLRKCVHRRVNRNEAVLQGLVIAVRWLSHRDPAGTVGRNLMALCIPKRSAEEALRTGNVLAVAAPPQTGRLTFLDLPEHGRACSYGPHVVHGGVVVRGFTVQPL